MANGKLKWYDETKGFGFITTDEGKDIFVHRTGFATPSSEINEGQEVEFDTKETDKGTVAINVKSNN
jgi:CspA family cold shock protein